MEVRELCLGFLQTQHMHLWQQLVSSSMWLSFWSICYKAFRSWWLVLLKKDLVRSSFHFSSPCCEKRARLPYYGWYMAHQNVNVWSYVLCLKQRQRRVPSMHVPLSSVILSLRCFDHWFFEKINIIVDRHEINPVSTISVVPIIMERSGILIRWKSQKFSGPVRSHHCNIFDSLLKIDFTLIIEEMFILGHVGHFVSVECSHLLFYTFQFKY